MPNLAWDHRYRAQRIRVTGINTEIKMTDEQHMSRPYITLDWADVEAWVKSNNKKLKPFQNDFGGYNIDCPVPTHQPQSQRLSVRPMKDGSVYVRCFGDCNHQDVRAAIAKEINSPPPTAPHQPFPRRKHPDEPPSVTKPPIEALEEEWNSPEAQLALDQLIDEQFANEQTAEYWEGQASDAKAELERERDEKSSLEEQLTSECDEERKKRVAAENTAQRLQTSVDKLSKYKDKVQDKQDELDKLRKDYNSVNDTLSRRDEKILEIDAERARLENERDQAYDDYEKLQEDLPVSKSEVIEGAWSLLDQVPNAAIKESWTCLETELYQALRHTLKVPGSRPKIQVLLNNAKSEKYINSEHFLHLLVIYDQRNKTTHPDKVTRTTLQLTKPEARAALAYLEPIIDRIRQRSPQTSS